MIELGVDEFTLVLRSNRLELKDKDWENEAEYLIWIFENKLGLKDIFGEKKQELNNLRGYNNSYKYGNHGFYFAISYHNIHSKMGICVKFSAQSLRYYIERTGLKVYEILKKCLDKRYSIRLSRIDLIADYIDEYIDLDKLYSDYTEEKVAVYQTLKKGGKNLIRKCNLCCSGYLNDSRINTLYFGSPQSKSRLRIYDKKFEQISKKGILLRKAIECNSWIRFEAVFKDEFAHKITQYFLNIEDDLEFLNLIANIIIQKFCFYIDGTNKMVDFSYFLNDMIIEKQVILKNYKKEDNDLINDIIYHYKYSELMSFIFKIKKIWGEDDLKRLVNFMLNLSELYEANKDCISWLDKYKNDYKSYCDFDDYIDKHSVILKYALGKKVR